ncbi:hypothetical protein P389DRAFT_111015 [Cystobasidium minutum MCA 4210]|uniref:uncharacterized protein n=1 Tax=Cystobasidium minutum MCA 4210 TaxID=1397322 RepID=UPI0034D00BF9|eukprot:jgi/Rhomi1/111015/CE111014_2094
MATTSSSYRPNAAGSSRDEAFSDAEPPPPYEAVPHDGAQTLEANFARPYEVQDSGMFSQPAGAPPSSTIRPQDTGASSSYAPPPGAPPSTSSSSRLSVPPPPPRHPSTSNNINRPNQPSPIPSPHVDGISTFNRPALPNQQPAHTEHQPPPTRYAPSANPMSGQPLLHKGKILMYPPGVWCEKCHNTGYKAYDPNNPHEKCWNKYGRLYTAAVWDSPNFTFSNPTLQKPLPNSRHSASTSPPVSQPFSPIPPPQQYSHPGYYTAGQAGPPPPQMFSPPPMQQPMQQPPYMMGNPGQGYYNQPQMAQGRPMPYVSGMSYGPPPPGALIVRPGDPRIGGRLCMHCGGDGIVECGFLFLDTETCPSCNGTGRVFY